MASTITTAETRGANPFQTLTRAWMRNIHLAVDYKRNEFTLDAEEAMRFFDGPHDFMYKSDYASKSSSFQLANQSGAPTPTFRMTVNKVAEMVQIFGPHLYHSNPFRQITPRKISGVPAQALVGTAAGPQIEQLQQMLDSQNQQAKMVDSLRASLLSSYLNYTPNEMDLKTHARAVIDETLIKGMGCLWCEVYIPEGSDQRFIRSTYDSVDNLVVDPDMESIRDAKWISRRRVMPVWEVENRFGLKPGTIQGSMSSISQRAYQEATLDGEQGYYHQKGETNDLLVFWEIYSRMGAGHLMQQPQATYWAGGNRGPFRRYLEQFGSHIYMVVCEEYPYPLNVPKEVIERGSRDEIFSRLQWPTPFWADPADPWPMSYLAFHPRPRKVWPMSHLKPAMGELQFLNWAFSFLADKIKNTSRDFIGILKSAGEDAKTAILSGRDLSLIEIEKVHGTKITDVVSFLQHPEMNGDIWRVIEAVIKLFEQRTGLSELMTSGSTSKQLRSAEEARVKSEYTQIRPDDMANIVEDWMTTTARKEALAARWHIRPKDVLPIMGQAQAALWGQFVSSAEINTVTHEMEYRIESGSIRKPNREKQIANANSAVQMWGPVFQNFAMSTGQYGPLNGLAEYWAKANDMDPKPFRMEPPPPEPPQPDPTKMAEIQSKQQIESAKLELQRQKMEMDAAAQGQDIQQDREKHGMEMQKGEFDLSASNREMALKMQMSRLEHEQKEDEGEMEMEMMEFKLDAAAEEQRIKVAGMRSQQKIKNQVAKKQASKPVVSGNGKK